MGMYARIVVFAALMLPVAPALSATYSAAGDTRPGAPFQRFDAAHFGSTFFLSPYFGLGYTPTPNHSVAGGVYSSGQSDNDKYTFWIDDSQTLLATNGIDISARLKVTSSASVSTDRAGVAFALTDSNNNYAEVYLAQSEIFINGAGRVRSTTYAMDTTDVFHDYVVRVQGSAVS